MRNLEYISSFEVLQGCGSSVPFFTRWHYSKCSLRSHPPPPHPLSSDECKEAGLWGRRVFMWRLTGTPECIFITRYRVAKKYSLICVWVFGLFIAVFISVSNLVSNGSTISEQYKKLLINVKTCLNLKVTNTDITMEWWYPCSLGRHITTGNPVILSYCPTAILQMANLRQHCQISKYEKIRLLLTKGVEPVEICSQYVDV
jgi:hypothetical protein